MTFPATEPSNSPSPSTAGTPALIPAEGPLPASPQAPLPALAHSPRGSRPPQPSPDFTHQWVWGRLQRCSPGKKESYGCSPGGCG